MQCLRVAVPLAMVLSICLLTTSSAQDRPSPLRLVTDEQDALFRRFIPDSVDGRLQELREEDRLLWYTSAEVPRAFQSETGGLHAVNGGIPNVNGAFPWSATAGMDNTPNGSTLHFVLLPNSSSMTWWHQPVGTTSTTDTVIRWAYPEGTTFGEVLLVRDPSDDGSMPFEVRLRKKTKDETWKISVYRPFVKPEDLLKAIKELDSQWWRNEKLASWSQRDRFALDHLRGAGGLFDRRSLVDELPPIGTRMVIALLKRPFVSAIGQEWRQGTTSNFAGHAPTTNARFHIIPQGYRGHFMEVSGKACMTCHESTGKSARELGQPGTWRIRGDDGIFSFHPFAESSARVDGQNVAPRLNAALVRAGLLRHRDQPPTRIPSQATTERESPVAKPRVGQPTVTEFPFDKEIGK